jgi:hypothetical protein
MNDEPVSEVNNRSLVSLPEEDTSEEEGTDEGGYINDAEMPEME